MLPDSARTAPEAAAAVGMRGRRDREVAGVPLRRRGGAGPGVGREPRRRGARWRRSSARRSQRADADFARAATGFSIGGVPPLGHPAPLRTLVDEDLLGYEVVWAAAGTPHAVFPIAPRELAQLAGGRVVRLAAPAR